MRLLTFFAALALLGSAFYASRRYAARQPDFPIARFVTADAAARAREGEANKWLGVALSGYEALVREHPDDLEALRGRIRTGIVFVAVGVAQPRAPALAREQSDAYLKNRELLDPDGSFAKELAGSWVGSRMQLDLKSQTGFYGAASTGIFTGARGHAQGLETLFGLMRQGAFYVQFFPFARRYNPGWPVVEPLVVHYLEKGDPAERVEAGVTLLHYNALFGVGDATVDRFLPVVRDSVREMRERVRAFADDGGTDLGRAAILGMALLANRGEAQEMRQLAAAKEEIDLRSYAPHTDTVRIARMCVGLEDFARMGPLTLHHKDLNDMDRDVYYICVAHRAAHLMRQGASAEQVAPLLELLEAAFDGTEPALRVFAMEALLRLAPERGKALVEKALDARGPFAVYAGALADRVEDPVALFLPYLGSPLPEIAAIAAAMLLDLPHPHALQR